jgi:hypothetical protein
MYRVGTDTGPDKRPQFHRQSHPTATVTKKMKIDVFWDFKPCKLIDTDRRFREGSKLL